MNKVLDKFFTKADNGTVRLYDYDVTHLWLAGLVYGPYRVQPTTATGWRTCFAWRLRAFWTPATSCCPSCFATPLPCGPCTWLWAPPITRASSATGYWRATPAGIKYWHGSTILLWCSCLSFSARSWWAAFLSRCPASPCGITAGSPCM